MSYWEIVLCPLPAQSSVQTGPGRPSCHPRSSDLLIWAGRPMAHSPSQRDGLLVLVVALGYFAVDGQVTCPLIRCFGDQVSVSDLFNESKGHLAMCLQAWNVPTVVRCTGQARLHVLAFVRTNGEDPSKCN